MSKKRIGKGLKALIREESNENEAKSTQNQPEIQVASTENSNITPITPKNPDPEPPKPENNPVPIVTEVREPDPFFIENLKKERERRVRAIEAMNEVIRKYNSHGQ